MLTLKTSNLGSVLTLWLKTENYLGPCQTPMMELYCENS